MPRITLAQLKTLAKAHDYSVSKRDGEYRVAPYRPRDHRWAEDRAYYTMDAQDAMDTLKAMIAHDDMIVDIMASKPPEYPEDHATCTYPAWLDDAG